MSHKVNNKYIRSEIENNSYADEWNKLEKTKKVRPALRKIKIQGPAGNLSFFLFDLPLAVYQTAFGLTADAFQMGMKSWGILYILTPVGFA